MGTNKYAVLSYEQLVLFVQRESRELAEMNAKKGSSRTRIRRGTELSEARMALLEKIRNRDRHDITFFPVGSRVIFTDPYNGSKEEGEVVGYMGRFVSVKYLTDGPYQPPRSTLPDDLSLTNIRK